MFKDARACAISKELQVIHKSVGETFVLIRIPKTGSSSMSRAMWNLKTEKCRNSPPRFAPPKYWNHYSAQFCIETLGREKWEKSFTFTLVRNPWARLYSYWKQHEWETARARKQRMDPRYIGNEFEDWLLNGCRHDWTLSHHAEVFPKNPLISQLGWITDADGEILVNSVLRLEEINSTGSKLLKGVFGEKFKMGRLHLNRSSGTNEYQEHYTPEMIDYVSRHCEDDIKTFRYSFEGLVG